MSKLLFMIPLSFFRLSTAVSGLIWVGGVRAGMRGWFSPDIVAGLPLYCFHSGYLCHCVDVCSE